MPASQSRLGAVVFLLTAISWRVALPAGAQTPGAAADESPRAVVGRWLELHRTGKRDEASALTTGSPHHHARHVVPSNRDAGVRVERSLGNQQAAAVITNSLKEGREEVLLFWLVRRDGAWRINKSGACERRILDERLRGFLEAGDVRWHVRRGKLLGNWEAGPCTPPGAGGVACGSRLQLGDDNRYRLAAWGPFGPDPEYDDVMQGMWRVANGRILLSHQGRTTECRVAWIAENLLIVEPPDGKGRARYERTDAARADAAFVDKITEPVWGEAVNGIQLGISGIPQNSAYLPGERIRFALHLRNASNKTLHVLNDWPKPLGKVIEPIIETAAGERVEYPFQPRVRGGHKRLEHTLRPGETAVVDLQGTLSIGNEGESFPGKLPHERCWCSLSPGHYRILGGFLLTTVEPTRGESEGDPFSLTSGKVDIHITAREKGPPRPSEPHARGDTN